MIRLTNAENGWLGACERWPDSVLEDAGENAGLWSETAAEMAEKIANKLLGIGRGRRPRGLKQGTPKAEVLSSDIVADLAGSQRGWMYQHR